MGDFNKDPNQGDQAGQQTDKSAFGQFDKEGIRQDKSERGQQDREDLSAVDAGQDVSSAREQEIGQQGDFTGKGGQQQGQDGAQQGDNQYMKETGQGDDQNR